MAENDNICDLTKEAEKKANVEEKGRPLFFILSLLIPVVFSLAALYFLQLKYSYGASVFFSFCVFALAGLVVGYGIKYLTGKKEIGIPLIIVSFCAYIIVIVIYGLAAEPKKVVSQRPAMISSARSDPVSDTVTLKSGVYNFHLSPGQMNDKWLYVDEYHYYNLSSSAPGSDLQPFVIVYKNGTKVRVDGFNVKIPSKAGAFKIEAGEKGAKVNVNVYQKS